MSLGLVDMFTGITDTLEETGLQDPLRDLVTSVSDATDDIVDNTQTGLETLDPDNVGTVTETVGHVVSGVVQGVEELLPPNNPTEEVQPHSDDSVVSDEKLR